MTIISHLVFICDLCDRIETISERAEDYSEIDVHVEKLVPGWTTVWIDGNHDDLVCGTCFLDNMTKVEERDGGWYWIIRPIPEKNR